MIVKTGISTSLISIALTLMYAATWDLTWLYWSFVVAMIALLLYYQYETEQEHRREQHAQRERIRLIREREEFEIWCGLQEERAHRKLMETAVMTDDRT